jgi:hypothetical protein
MDKERRTKSRYPLKLNVRYQTMGLAGSVAGVGQTTDVSSSGVFVNCANNIREGVRMKAVIEWPSLLNGTTPLQLIIIGIVVRRQNSGFAIAYDGYQFRTAGRKANVATMPDNRVPLGYARPDLSTFSMVAKSL